MLIDTERLEDFIKRYPCDIDRKAKKLEDMVIYANRNTGRWESVFEQLKLDIELEEKWDELEDVLFIENADGDLALHEDWDKYKAGTLRRYIWADMFEKYSDGAYLIVHPIYNDYGQAIYFHEIEPGSLRLDDSSKENKVSIGEVRINPDRINFLEISNGDTCKIARLSASSELDKIMGIYTEKNHDFAFSVNYYARLQDTNEFDIIACVTVCDEKLLKESFSDIADRVIKLADTYRDIEPVVVPLSKEELNIIEEKFNDYYINVYGNDDIER